MVDMPSKIKLCQSYSAINIARSSVMGRLCAPIMCRSPSTMVGCPSDMTRNSQIGRVFSRLPPCPANYIPVCGDMIAQQPGCAFVRLDLDAWKSCCRQCNERTDHVCPVKKLKHKPRAEGGGGAARARLARQRMGLSGATDQLAEESATDIGPKSKGYTKSQMLAMGITESQILLMGAPATASQMLAFGISPSKVAMFSFLGEDYCQCPGKPQGKQRAKICRCNPYKPLNFVLQVEVRSEHRPPFVPKPKKSV